MTTPAQFQHKVSEMSLDGLKSSEERAAALEQLHELEQDIQREIRVIEVQYQKQIEVANRGGSSQVMMSNRQAGSERRRAEQVEKLQTELNGKLQPYQEVLQQVVEHIRVLEAA